MNDDNKARLTLSDAAQAVLHSAASPRKRGEFVSRLLVQYGAVDGGIDQVEIEGIRLQLMGLAGANKTMDARVMKIERQLSAVIASTSMRK